MTTQTRSEQDPVNVLRFRLAPGARLLTGYLQGRRVLSADAAGEPLQEVRILKILAMSQRLHGADRAILERM